MSDNTTHEEKIEYIKNLMETENFCILPFVNLNTNTNGKVKLCCNIHFDRHVSYGEPDNYVEFNMGEHSIDDIWNSAYMNSIRWDMLKDDTVDDCKGCKQNEERTGFSPRIGQNQKWIVTLANDYSLLSDVYHNIKEFRNKSHVGNKPYSYELRLGNQCNLKCNSCWTMSSNQIQHEQKEWLEQGIVPEEFQEKFEHEVAMAEREISNWYETEQFFKNFEKSVHTLQRLYTTGGEPTLIKSNYRILEKLIQAGNTSCRIEFTTNMTTYNNEFYNRLTEFDNVEAQVSIDAIGKHAEYIRYPCIWMNVHKNFDRLLRTAAEKENWTIIVYTVYQALNYDHLTELWKYLHEMAKIHKVKIHWWPIPLDYPAFLGLSVVPKEKRNKLVNYYDYARQELRNKYLSIPDPAFEVVRGSLEKTEFNKGEQERFDIWYEFNNRARNIQDPLAISHWRYDD